MSDKLCLLGLMLVGCASNLIVPSAAQVDVLRCRRQIRKAAVEIESMHTNSSDSKYPATYGTAGLVCPATRKHCIVFEASEKRDRFRIFCGGHQHAAAGQAQDTPSYDSSRGLDTPPQLPAGFPLKLTFNKLLIAEAQTEDGKIHIEAEVDPLVSERELEASLGASVNRQKQMCWSKETYAGADKLVALLDKAHNHLYIRYFPAYLKD